MGTYDTIGGTPRHDPAFDRNPPDVCIECEIDPDDCPGEDHCGLVRLARSQIGAQERAGDQPAAVIVNDILYDAFKTSATAGIGCIVYVFDSREDGGDTGFNTKNCDMGDAMVAIKRIAEQFDIDLEKLAGCME